MVKSACGIEAVSRGQFITCVSMGLAFEYGTSIWGGETQSETIILLCAYSENFRMTGCTTAYIPCNQ